MAAIDDLKTAVSDLSVSVSTEIQAVIDKLATIPAGNDAEIAAVTATLVELKSKLDAETAVLTT